MKFKNISFRVLPYIMSFLCAMVFFCLANSEASPDKLSRLFIAMSAVLFASPIAFGFFKVMRDAMSSETKNVMTDCVMFSINGQLLGLVMILRDLLQEKSKLTIDNFNCFLAQSKEEIHKKMAINEDIARELEMSRKKLISTIHQLNAVAILNEAQLVDLLALIVSIDTLVMSMRCRLAQKNIDKNEIAKTIETILNAIANWSARDDVKSIIEHRYFEFLSEED